MLKENDTFMRICEISFGVIEEAGEDTSEYVVRAQPFGVVERLDGEPLPEEVEEALYKKFQLN